MQRDDLKMLSVCVRERKISGTRMSCLTDKIIYFFPLSLSSLIFNTHKKESIKRPDHDPKEFLACVSVNRTIPPFVGLKHPLLVVDVR